MTTAIKFEENSSRKSYRTNIPLRVVIANQSYLAIDWSLTGLGLGTLKMPLEDDQIIQALLVLQMPEAAISIPVKLKLEYKHEDRFGFSYVDFNDKNKKVLRRFIELSIEGKTNIADDVIAIYEEPPIDTPVDRPVKLDDIEKKNIKRDFRISSIKYIVFALAMLALLGGLLFFNLRYSFEGTGIVVGNYHKVYPRTSGILEKIYVKEGDNVKSGDTIAQIDTQELRHKISLLEAQKIQKSKVQTALQKQQEQFDNSDYESAYIKAIKDKADLKKSIYLNAQKQYAQRLITFKTFNRAKDAYLDTQIKLKNAKNNKMQHQKQRLQNHAVSLDTNDLDLKIAYAKESLKMYRITAPVTGRVYEFYAIEGENADKNRPLLTLWTHAEPSIIVNVPNQYISKIAIGTKADLVDKSNQKHYKASVVKIGTVDESDNTDDVVVTLKANVPVFDFKPHQRVSVLFQRGF